MVSSRWASSALVKPLIKVRKRIRALSPKSIRCSTRSISGTASKPSILPALWAGKTVIADRYLFTALARDAARGLELDWLLHVYSPLLWPDLVIYFAMTPQDSSRRVAATRAPRFYEVGQDVTGIEDPLTSYRQFIDRVITEYDNLSVIFQFVKVDADQAVYRQHQQVRELVEKAERALGQVQRRGSQGMADKTQPWPADRRRRLARQRRRRAAEAIVARLSARGIGAPISRWDASGLFGDLAAGGPAIERRDRGR